MDLGHTRIGIITLRSTHGADGVPTENRPALQRMLGWREALDAAGIEPVVQAAQFHPHHDPHLSVETIARDLLDRPDRPTAVLCFSDAFAITTIQVAQSLGLQVPEDLSVVGFDDSRRATESSPQLTTVHQEVATKGTEAVRVLMAIMGPNRPESVERILLPTSLVVRESTAPPPA